MTTSLKVSRTDTQSPAAVRATRRSSTKLQSQHLDGLTMVYVRHATSQEVCEHQESAARQYALVELGWSPDHIEVIDEDQGHSGATAEGRSGVHRLLAEVGFARL